jgi:hypothetical protein
MSLPSGESIYNLIPKTVTPESKPPRYKSMFSSTVRSDGRQDKACSKTMGPAKVQLSSPQDFLKKHSKEQKLPEREARATNRECKPQRPLVPRHTEQPQMGSKSNKNYVTTNAVNNIMAVPRKPAAKYVDTVSGDTFDLVASGLVPKYTNKKDYGKVPGFLERRREDMTAAQAEYDCYIEESLRRGQMEQVTEEERDTLLAGLKANWEDLHHQYQGLSVITDTAPKKARKERMEAEMKQLEKDIELLERHHRLYISERLS